MYKIEPGLSCIVNQVTSSITYIFAQHNVQESWYIAIQKQISFIESHANL